MPAPPSMPPRAGMYYHRGQLPVAYEQVPVPQAATDDTDVQMQSMLDAMSEHERTFGPQVVQVPTE